MKEEKDWNLTAYNTVGHHIQRMMDSTLGTGEDAFFWIKNNPMLLSEADLIFSARDKVFALVIACCLHRKGRREIALSEVQEYKWRRLLEKCRRFDFLPVAIVLNPDFSFYFSDGGWSLVNLESLLEETALSFISPEKLVGTSSPELSEFEIIDFCYQYLEKEFEKRNWSVITRSNELEPDPQVFFSDENGNIGYMLIRYTLEKDKAPGLPEDIFQIDKKLRERIHDISNAYYASFSVYSEEGRPRRTRNFSLSFYGIQKLEFKR